MTPSPRSPLDASAPLCPGCRNPNVLLFTTARVTLEITLDPDSQELRVVNERHDTSDWDETSPVRCARCGWQGVAAMLETGLETPASP